MKPNPDGKEFPSLFCLHKAPPFIYNYKKVTKQETILHEKNL